MTAHRRNDKTNHEAASTIHAVITIDDLLALDGEAFVRQAYKALLRRDPDPGGLVNYLGYLDNGVSKLDVIGELRSSVEGRRHNVKIAGLDDLDAEAEFTTEATARAVRDIQQLLKLEGEQFVESAYVTLFHRPVDPQGLRHYLPLLRRTHGKAEVLRQLVSSDEYQRHQTQLRGLTPWLAQQPRPRLRILERLSRLFGAAESQGTLAGASATQSPTPQATASTQPTTSSPSPSKAALAMPCAKPAPANGAALALMTLTPFEERTARRDHE